jgi:hypothetical protein
VLKNKISWWAQTHGTIHLQYGANVVKMKPEAQNVLKRTNKLSKTLKKNKAVPLHATKALGGRAGIAPTHS